MNKITEVFLEGWNDATQMCQACGQGVVELEHQGFHCTVRLFYNALNGNRIYLLEAISTDSALSSLTTHRSAPQRRKSSPATSSRPIRTQTR